ncbi:dipeptide epimerase [Sphingobium sp. CR28]|uniref:dipeptide epimerase n=1 Tax=Sphingobium sp. CR28 TaxID=3400272 RepID=UPI003FF0E0DE
MARLESVSVERWPVAGSFNIARGAKTYVDVVHCVVTDGRHRGQGEGTAIYYHGETAESCAQSIRVFAEANPTFDRETVNVGMPPGAARNALDCALWDMEAKAEGAPVWQLAELPEPRPLATAFTVSLDTPAVMEAAARKAALTFGLLKCKLTGEGDRDRIAAVREGAPDVRLIVDANESWRGRDIALEAEALAALGVELIEQPLPAGDDAGLADVRSSVPFCADESCQSARDLPNLRQYQAINIKLDKAGGLSEAIAMRAAARRAGQKIMLGCMLSTSLGIAPPFLLAGEADWVDLDGALLLANDRAGGFVVRDGLLQPGAIWG